MPAGPLSKRTVDELLQQASTYETMAASARTLATAESLLRLAKRFREMAWRRVGTQAYRPGEPAPLTGLYCQLNIFGTKTDMTIHLERGVPMPVAPRDFTWCLVKVLPAI